MSQDSTNTKFPGLLCVQLSVRWKKAGVICALPHIKVCELDLQLREVKRNKESRLEYVINQNGDFSNPVCRAAALIFLMECYEPNRRRSEIAHQKWLKARDHLLLLQHNDALSSLAHQFFDKVAKQGNNRPARPRGFERYSSR